MKLLLLAGTSDARRLAERLAEMPDVEVTASYAGATRQPEVLPVPTRIGGFGGRGEQEKYIKDNGFKAIVDATHPFAHRITTRTANIARALGVPHLMLRRPGWVPGDGDDWTFLDKGQDAAQHIPVGATVFLATGRQTLQEFSNLADRTLICRQIDPPDGPFPFPNGEFLVGRPPFSVEDEMALFQARKVDVLVVKNAGGALSRTKLDAARILGIPVLLIRRPPLPPGPRVSDVEAALAWVRALCA